MKTFLRNRDTRWLVIWITATLIAGIWDLLFLNKPALDKVVAGFFNTAAIALLSVTFTLMLGWSTTLLLHHYAQRKKSAYLFLTFMLNLIRSVPQIVGVLFGYVMITMLITANVLQAKPMIFMLMALCMALFIFPELVDLMRDRIAHFTKLDFVSAMRVAGVPERRIINFDILWKNSCLHIFNKLIAVLGCAVFLQCSVDFIISVGLSSDVNDTVLPVTLGNLLATIDSKQDILAIGYALTHPLYAGSLFFEHLQGMTVAFLLVFSLVSIFHISNGYAERHRL
ncbi:MAG: hypothetical protein MUF22_06825 [Chitinispirillaceae bacterium]|jgi:ABC-type dipeptide/oligopeptide/nickel transport system permease subunit|nr:hypothetical protein [Chitinispirillaceae bacterium]